MNNKSKRILPGIIGTIFILLFVVNLFNKIVDYPVPPKVVTSIILGITVYTLIIVVRDLELAHIKRDKKYGIKPTDPKSIKNHKCSKSFSQLRDSIAIILGIIITFISYFSISKYTDKAIPANTWGSTISDSLTLMVFGLIIYLYVYEKEDEEDEETISSNIFSVLFCLISISIKPIIMLLSLSVIFIVIIILLIMEVKMGNILSILAIIFSGAISAFIYTRASSCMKVKELEVKLKLEEKNKWIENINNAHKDYMESTTQYMNDLMAYSLNQVNREHIANKLNTVNKTHNSLIFFMYQSEYNSPSVKEAEKLMKKNIECSNDQREIAILYLKKEIDINKLGKKMGDIEEDIGANNYEFSENLGIMIREEKKKMTTEIIERK